MVVASAQNAVQSGALVGTFPGYVTKFVTSSTLYRWIRPKIVARALLLKFTKHIIDLILSLLFILTLQYVIILLPLLLLIIWIPLKVHIALDSASRDDQIRVSLSI